MKPLDSDLSETTFTVSKLSTPVTKSVVLLAKPDEGSPEQVVIKIFDPRYLDERISDIPSRASYPWDLVNERAAATARPQNLELSDDDLVEKMYSDEPEDLSGEALATHNLFWEERFHRLMMECYDSEHKAYERLRDLQGSAIARLIMAGHFLPPDERTIQPPALVMEYIPSVDLLRVPASAITPAIRSQVLSTIESFPLHGVIHNDITLTNIHFTPPEQPVRGFILDFGCAIIRKEDEDEEYWLSHGASDVKWAKRLLEEEDLRKSFKQVPSTNFK